MGSSWRWRRRRRMRRRRRCWRWKGRRGGRGGHIRRGRIWGGNCGRGRRGEGRGEGRPHRGSKDLVEYLRARTRGEVRGNPFGEEVKGAGKAVKASYYVPYVQHTPMEPRAAVAEWGEDGGLTVWTSTQNPFGV